MRCINPCLISLNLPTLVYRFCQNVDAKDLSISVTRGEVKLNNVEVKPTAFDDLKLPITVKSGTVHMKIFAQEYLNRLLLSDLRDCAQERKTAH